MARPTKKPIGATLHKHGVAFRVWAPFAAAVAVTGSFNNWQQTPLESEGDGYWAGEVKGAPAGAEYKFVINTGHGELFRNDPRSLQLTTSAGNSVIVDQAYDWEDDNFQAPPVNQQVLYELHIGTFNRSDAATTGTFARAAEKLDYLASLGVNMVELMPINSMSMDRGWGYATDYIYAIESLYGGRHEFLDFVKLAHQKGIGVILDVVYNHFGPDSNLDLWQFDGWSQDGKGGIYFYNDWRSKTPWGDTRPDFGRQEVRSYITDNVQMWLQDFHLDGLRVDSTIFIRNVEGRNNDPQNDIAEGWAMLQEITNTVHKVKPKAIVIGEDTSGNDYITKPTTEGGAGFDSQWEVNFPSVMRKIMDVIDDSQRNLSEFASSLTRQYNGHGLQRIIYSDSHDSAANGGARLSEEITPGNATSVFSRERSLIASAIILTATGIPMLFQGQEFMEGGSFNDWQSLDWTKAEKFRGIVAATTDLVALRKNAYGNTAGLLGNTLNIIHLNDESKVLAYHRFDKGGPNDDVVVIINFANRVQKDYHLFFPRKGLWRVRFNSAWKGYSRDFKDIHSADVEVENDTATLNLAPYSVIIFSQDK